MANELDARLLVHQAEQSLNQWLAQYSTSLSSEAVSPESQGMMITLMQIGYNMRIQLHAIQEQLLQDIWEERLACECADDERP